MVEKKTITLERGEQITILGQGNCHLVVINLDGEIYTKIDSGRDD